MKTFAFECYADEDIFIFLRDQRRLPLRKFHGFGQGEVVNALLIRETAEIGMVDEDPGRSHHRERDNTVVVETTTELQMRRRGGRHLILLRPTLEECFLRGMRTLQLASRLPTRESDLHAILNVPNRAKHAQFREELEILYEESRGRRLETFITKLEDVVQPLI